MSTEAKPESTAVLIDRIHDGQEAAREELFRRCLPLLRRFAHGRLPATRRDSAETDDLVQITLLRALRNLERFESRGQGAFLAYLRQIMRNAIIEEARKQGRRPPQTGSIERLAGGESVLDQVIGEQALQAYDAALAGLGEESRAAVVMRLEYGMSYPEIAVELGAPSADAARMRVGRALKQLAEHME